MTDDDDDDDRFKATTGLVSRNTSYVGVDDSMRTVAAATHDDQGARKRGYAYDYGPNVQYRTTALATRHSAEYAPPVQLASRQHEHEALQGVEPALHRRHAHRFCQTNQT